MLLDDPVIHRNLFVLGCEHLCRKGKSILLTFTSLHRWMF